MNIGVSAFLCFTMVDLVSGMGGSMDNSTLNRIFCSEFPAACQNRRALAPPQMTAELWAKALQLEVDTYRNLPGSQFYCKSKYAYRAEAIARDGIFFCDDYVDYAVACDAQEESSCNNTWTIEMHRKFQNALKVFQCGTYSNVWTCANCSSAYKRWLCTQSWRKHYMPATELVEEGKVCEPHTLSTTFNNCLDMF